jgi:hypothetical protein
VRSLEHEASALVVVRGPDHVKAKDWASFLEGRQDYHSASCEQLDAWGEVGIVAGAAAVLCCVGLRDEAVGKLVQVLSELKD